ncbi:MAG: 1-acyl-sn-glycerol-3-phosphate acyltransferase [Robiginitomaculum sp.]|nr:MAG: 1-acyl-sn-glycerol-3-phosphate acyltransferase [Robiginitomaculum sp.]
MRSFLFNILFYILSVFFALACVLLSLLPGRKPIMLGLWAYSSTMVWLMRVVAGIKVEVKGHENLPEKGPYIIAPKHQSYGDGFVVFSQFFNLSFVTGDHLEKFMTLKHILRKAGAVVIDNCGGTDARDRLQTEAEKVGEGGRRLLIYPEGHLSAPGEQRRYRKGIFHLYEDFGCAVVPMATNLGQRWNQNVWTKYKGSATVEFLEPIEPGLGKDEFMHRLETMIETRSLELLDYENPGALEYTRADLADGAIMQQDRIKT